MVQPETDDQRAERLLRIAMDVAVRIREEPPEAVAREFGGLDYQELRDLALLAAACIPIDRPVSGVVWWTDLDRVPKALRHRQPCGTHAAYNRHKARSEPVDLACEVAERKYNADRYQLQRARPPAIHRSSTSLPPGMSTHGAGTAVSHEERLAA